MNIPPIDKAGARSAWIVTAKILLPLMIDHEASGEANPARWVIESINEENGFDGLCDWPEHYRILTVEPYTNEAWERELK